MPKIDTYNSKTEKDFFTYSKAISLLEDVKLVHGGDGLVRTLQRHWKLRQFLIDYQKTAIIDLEHSI